MAAMGAARERILGECTSVKNRGLSPTMGRRTGRRQSQNTVSGTGNWEAYSRQLKPAGKKRNKNVTINDKGRIIYCRRAAMPARLPGLTNSNGVCVAAAQDALDQDGTQSTPQGMCSMRHSTAASSTAEAMDASASSCSQGRSFCLRRASMACAAGRGSREGGQQAGQGRCATGPALQQQQESL